MNDIFQIGFIGAGGIATFRHLPNLVNIAGVRLIAVANQTIESARRAAETFGFEKVYTEWKDVVNDPEVHMVFICTPPNLHREMTCYALAQGKHVFCQARMGMDLEDAKMMLVADEQSPLTTMLCPPPHYQKVEPFMHRLIKEGRLGEIRHVLLTHPSSVWLDPSEPLHWRQRADIQGINLLDVGIMGEVLQRCFGPIQSVSAIGQTWHSERPADKDGRTTVELPDALTVSGRFTSGATLTALFSGSVYGGSNHILIYGTKGTLTCFKDTASLKLETSAGIEIIEIPPEQVGQWTVERDFLDAVLERRKGSPNFQEGFRYMSFTQAVNDSMQSGQQINI